MIPDVSICYNNTEMDTLLYTNYPSISAIYLTLQSYLTSTQIDDSYYTKSEIDTTLNFYSPSAQILSNFYSKLYIDNMFLTSAQKGALYYTKTDTGKLLSNNVSTTGDVSISGNLEAQKLILNKQSDDNVTPLKIFNNNQNCEVIALESTIAGDGCLQNLNKKPNHLLYGILGYGIKPNMILDMVLMEFGFTIMVIQQ